MAYGIAINSASTPTGTVTSTTDSNLHPGVLLQQNYATVTSNGAVDSTGKVFSWISGSTTINFSANAGSYTKFSVVINNTGSGGTWNNAITQTGLTALAMVAAPTATVDFVAKTVTLTIGPSFRINVPGFDTGTSVILVNNYYCLIFGIG